MTSSETRKHSNILSSKNRKQTNISSSETKKQAYVFSSSVSEAQTSNNNIYSPVDFSLGTSISQKMISWEAAKLSTKEIHLMICYRLDSLDQKIDSMNKNMGKKWIQ